MLSFTKSKQEKINETISYIKSRIYLRSDIEDNLRYLVEHRPDVSEVIENRIIATSKLQLRLREANFQNKAGLVFDNFAPKGIGKSFWNYILAYKILKSRGVENWQEQIKIKTSTGNIINSPSTWSIGIQEMAKNIKNIDDGSLWSVLQDEKDYEFGKGARTRRSAQNDGIDKIRKLGTILGFASPFKGLSSFDNEVAFDIKFFTLGYDWQNGTNIYLSLMFYYRCQGIVEMRCPDEVLEFLMKEYETDAKKQVLKDAKTGFVSVAIDPEIGSKNKSKSKENNEIISIDTSAPEWKYNLLQELILDYWENDQSVTLTYARLLTSFFLWKDPMYDGRKKKNLKVSDVRSIDDVIATHVSKWWDVSSQSFNQARSEHSEKYPDYEKSKFDTHVKEMIGEDFSERVMVSELEYLNHRGAGVRGGSSQLQLVVEKKYAASKFLQKGGKSYDLCIVLTGLKGPIELIELMAINHKLVTSSKRFSKKQMDEYFGISPHPVNLIWITWTRPFKEKFMIKIEPGLFDQEHRLLYENIKEYNDFGDLGTQWQELDFKQLKKIFEIAIEFFAQEHV